MWAAGDATGGLSFTRVGTCEAQLEIDDCLGTPRPRDDRVVPRVTSCDPEVASVGLTERQARDAGHDVVTASYPITSDERAHLDGSTAGLVKLGRRTLDGRAPRRARRVRRGGRCSTSSWPSW